MLDGSTRNPRVPPNSERLERSVIAAAIYDAEARRQALDLLSAEDFYAPIRGELWGAIAGCEKAGKGLDTLLVLEQLRASPRAREAAIEVESCNAALSLSVDVEAHCLALRRLASSRALVRTCMSIAAEGLEPCEDYDGFLDRGASAVAAALATRADSVETEMLGDVAAAEFDAAVERANNPRPEARGVATGLYDLDRILGGLKPGALYVVAARPGLGKSTLGLQFARSIARTQKRVVFFSLEMSAAEIAIRALSSGSGVDSRAIATGEGLAGALGHVEAAVRDLQLPIVLPKARRTTIEVIMRSARREQLKHGQLGCVVVDYLQLVAATGKHGNREQEVAEVSRGLKLLALELEVPVVAMAQLNRGVEARADKTPLLSDLRESGAIEQDADVVMFIHAQEGQEFERKLVVAKHRGGSVGTAEVLFQPQVTRFVNKAR